MKGKFTIIIKNRRVTYTLELERNITIIRGDSATGKTSLIQSLAAYESLKEKSGVSVNCAKACHVFRTENWEEEMKSWKDSIVFADEGNAFITSQAFAAAIRESDNYYVLITRESLFQLPYSINAVLELRKTTSRFKHTYNRTYPYYHILPNARQLLEKVKKGDGSMSPQTILTEDSSSGFEWFSFLADKAGIHCISSGGKSSVFTSLLQHKGGKILVFADGAAFGAEMERVYQYTQLHPETTMLYLPESFEWLILRSGILHDEEIRTVLASPSDYIDSRLYFSWEQFFSAYLTEKSKDTVYQYSKTKLNSVLTHEHCIAKMLQVIENG